MTKENIKKELKRIIKRNGWNRSLTMGQKQMEKNIALLAIGWVNEDRFDSEALFEKIVSSAELNDFLEKVNGSLEREIRKIQGEDFIYILFHYSENETNIYSGSVRELGKVIGKKLNIRR